jgi:predicted nucleic acid-binding protein
VRKLQYLLDSMILIDHLNSVEKAGEFLATHEGLCAISVITRAEVLAGCDESNAGPITELLDRFPVLGIETAVADQAARLRRQFKWKLPDAFQASLAQVHSLSLANGNTKDFPPQRHSFVVVPYRV